MKKNEINPIQRLIEAGSNIAGAAGGAIGAFLGGAEGAALGGVTGGGVTGILKTIGDVAHRNLSKREEIRIGAAVSFAIDKIRIRLRAGETPRNDGFFQEREYDSRSDAEEILEGALLKSKNEHEEKKIQIIANIFANVAFSSDISTREANHILQVAEGMTYRKMCLLALFERKAEIKGISLGTKDTSNAFDGNEDSKPIVDDLSILQEIYELNNSGLVGLIDRDSNSGQVVANNIYTVLFDLNNVIPDKMHLTDLGKRYYTVMNLSEISEEDLREIATALSK